MFQGLRTPENARVIYVDMNSFFASVEQQNDPSLRGRPIAVVSAFGPKGTVLAASVEAKRRGVKTVMRMPEALALCPELFPVKVGHTSYRVVHKKMMAILADVCGPEARARSIDEAVIPLSQNWYGSEKAHAVAHEIKRRFREELGECITCSVGIAPNGFLAKLATDLQKPDGLIEITLENVEEVLGSLTLTDLPGIGRRMAARLATWGISTPLDLHNRDAASLKQQFGIWGQQWWWRLHGYEPDVAGGAMKTMSHQHALAHWTTETKELEPVLDRMIDRLIHRLRRNGFSCSSAGAFISIKGQRGIGVEKRLAPGTQTYEALWEAFHTAFADLPAVAPGPIRLMGVWLGGLAPAANGYQLDLFHKTEKDESISKALEFVRERHGFEAIQRGTVIRLDPEIASEKLGFGRVKDI